jgi:hypothetical protein
MMNSRRCLAILLAAWFLQAAGCHGSRLIATKGTVTLDGVPVENAVVQFYPESSQGTYAHATTRGDGSFSMNTNAAEGAEPGNYRVVVVKFEVSPQAKAKRSVLPSAYGSKDTTPLRCIVPHDGPVLLELHALAEQP